MVGPRLVVSYMLYCVRGPLVRGPFSRVVLVSERAHTGMNGRSGSSPPHLCLALVHLDSQLAHLDSAPSSECPRPRYQLKMPQRHELQASNCNGCRNVTTNTYNAHVCSHQTLAGTVMDREYCPAMATYLRNRTPANQQATTPRCWAMDPLLVKTVTKVHTGNKENRCKSSCRG